MENYNSLGVHIKVADINKSLKFYLALQFLPFFAYGSVEFLRGFKAVDTTPENYNGVTFKKDNILLEIADGHLAVKPEVFKESVASSKISLMINVKSVDEVVEDAVRGDIKIAVKPRRYPWGTREVVIKDPDGVVIVFIESLN